MICVTSRHFLPEVKKRTQWAEALLGKEIQRAADEGVTHTLRQLVQYTRPAATDRITAAPFRRTQELQKKIPHKRSQI
ncbi:hypothetical protein DPX16_16022 [Anabarilius grahami]|uniref:Uncharacterized protein n=1 Tax=Anabarilius grahami TaxID=495550 RepID=A0A3N0YU25_ANAGA|nr:hypothetical protein DPX16_16022 [Anabarilius grahami]